MGMATNTDDTQKVSMEFAGLHDFFLELKARFFKEGNYFHVCSMGMSADYELAIAAGSNMVRIGSLLFGARN